MHKIKKALPWILVGLVVVWWLWLKGKGPALVLPPVVNAGAPTENLKTAQGLPAVAVANARQGTPGVSQIGKWGGILHGNTAQILAPLTEDDAGWLFDTFPGLVSIIDSNGTVFANR